MRPRAFTDREFYRRRPVVSEVPVTLALLVGTALIVLFGTRPVIESIESADPGLLPVVSLPALIVASQALYGLGLALVALTYVHARDIDVPVAVPSRDDAGPVAASVLAPPVLVAVAALGATALGGDTFAEVAGSWYAEEVSAVWVVQSSLSAVVFVSVGTALLYHGAAQGTFRAVTDADRAVVATTGLVGLFVLVVGNPVFFAGGLGSPADAVGLGATVAVVGVAAWAYDRADTLAAPIFAYASYILAVEVAAYLTSAPTL